MKRGNKLWEGHRMILPEHRTRMIEQELAPYVAPVLYEEAQEEIEHQVQEAIRTSQSLRLVIGEPDGEHTVEGHVIGFRSENRSLQIRNEWGRFQIPIQNIVRVL